MAHRALTIGLLCALACVPTIAQDSHDHPVPEKLGEVTFPVTCGPAVQPQFNRAVALIHSFAYQPAELAFQKIESSNPQCAMAHWGVAMSYFHQLWDPRISDVNLTLGRSEIVKAQQSTNVSPRERQFIDALAAFYSGAGKLSERQRILDYEKGMAALAGQNSDDPETQIFYALALLASALPSDRTHINQKKAIAILEPLFHQFPQHPGVAHYLIHAYDSPALAAQGLAAARAYSSIAPSTPHALHMPSHIFTQLGFWQDSIHSNLAARKTAHEQGDIGEELHAMDYLIYAYLQTGENSDAAGVLSDLHAMRALPTVQYKVAYADAAMPVRYALERRQWKEAAALHPLAGAAPQFRSLTLWARAFGSARQGDRTAASADIKEMEQILSPLQSNEDPYWATQVDIQIHEAKAWLARCSANNDEALALLRAAVDLEESEEKRPMTPGPVIPAREQVGDLLLELDRPAKALQEFELSLTNSPGRRGGLSGAYQAALKSGNSAKAERFAEELAAQTPKTGP